MRKLHDFDEYRQGIPKRKIIQDLETGRALGIKYVTWGEFITMQQSLEKKLSEQTALLEKLLAVVILASSIITEEDIDKELTNEI